jgi:predicted Rossmann fold nucleotide-binding protein DprA/Smf involved in DNA uptake
MKKLTDQLQSVSRFLVNLSKQVEKISSQVDKHQSAKAKPVTAKPVKAKKAPAAKAPKAKKDAPAKPAAILGTVYDVIKRSKKSVTITKIKEKTSLGTRQISNALHKLSKQGKIESISRGLYVKK